MTSILGSQDPAGAWWLLVLTSQPPIYCLPTQSRSNTRLISQNKKLLLPCLKYKIYVDGSSHRGTKKNKTRRFEKSGVFRFQRRKLLCQKCCCYEQLICPTQLVRLLLVMGASAGWMDWIVDIQQNQISQRCHAAANTVALV